jgi:enterochelin esterase-like enzyme
VLADFIPSDLLPQPLEFRVYLPPCYEEDAGRRYPVLYLVHGQSYTHDQWDRLGADETASALIARGDLPPFLIVMPRDRVWTQPGQDDFGRALMQELIPYIDAAYRTCPERACRAIGGLSRGAAWALHLGLSEWESFSALGLHSLPVFWDDVPRLRGWLAAIPPEDLPRIYLDVGERDRDEIKESTFWFRDLLDELGIPHEYTLFSGYHDEEYWASHVEQYLRFYAAGWRE